MIKVVHLIHGLNLGGAETIVKDYVLRLNRNKFKIIILCYQRLNTPYEKIIEEAGIPIICVADCMPFPNSKNICAKFVHHTMRYILIKKELKKIDPDIVHEHLCLSSFIKFAKLKRTTVIFYTQHFNVENWKKNHLKDIKITKWLMKNYKVQMIAINDSMKREIDKVFNNDTSIVLRPGVDINRFQNTLSKEIIRRNLGLSQDDFVVGHVGRFSKEKNHIFLVDIFKEILSKRENSFLLMVGNGSMEIEIRNKLQDLGLEDKYMILYDRTDIQNLMKAMDILVFPSITEGLGMVLIEAQISGIKCLASDRVPYETRTSNLIKYINLNETAENWAKEALTWEIDKVEYFDVDKWDVNLIVNNLEELYSREL